MGILNWWTQLKVGWGKLYNCFYSFSQVSVNASDLYLIICIFIMSFSGD